MIDVGGEWGGDEFVLPTVLCGRQLSVGSATDNM